MKTKTNRKPAKTKPVSRSGATASTILPPETSQSNAAKAADPRWRWHYQKLLALRDRLERDRAQKRTDAGEPLEPYSMDMADSASDDIQHDLSLAELSAEQNLLFEVEEAIRRILAGAYGLCQETGRPIPLARLRVIPWARFSATVEARLEKNGEIPHPHLGSLGSVTGAAAPSFTAGDAEPAPGADEHLEELTVPVQGSPSEPNRQRRRNSPRKS